MSGSCLEIHGLKKSYGLKPILRGIELLAAPGERVALLGANGAGKTTLLRILACLTKPSAGVVCVLGLNSVQEAQRVRSLVGLVAHQPYLYEELTAEENLLFFARMYNVARGKERAWVLLQRVGLERRAHERVKTLSRGQVQRVALARALLHAPRLLLLDEPETGLDQEGTVLIEQVLREHSEQGGTTLFTTHQLERALVLADRVVMLAHGRVAYQQETATLQLASMRQTYQELVR